MGSFEIGNQSKLSPPDDGTSILQHFAEMKFETFNECIRVLLSILNIRELNNSILHKKSKSKCDPKVVFIGLSIVHPVR